MISTSKKSQKAVTDSDIDSNNESSYMHCDSCLSTVDANCINRSLKVIESGTIR